LFRGLDQNRVRLYRVIAKRQVLAVPLDQPERHIDDWEIAEGLLQLDWAHELHLHGGWQVSLQGPILLRRGNRGCF
jgi:hypothetical protein